MAVPVFFFSSRRRHTRFDCDWSSDVCSSDLGSVNIAIGKAKTALNFKRPTKALEDLVAGGRQVFLALEGITPLQGGLPVVARSEERRVGKECRSRWSPYH